MLFRSLEKDPNDVSILFHQAKAYLKLEDKAHAKEAYKRIVDISIDTSIKSKALYELATNRDSATEFDLMVHELEQSYELDPNEDADGYLAIIYSNAGNYEKAEKWLTVVSERIDIMNDSIYLRILQILSVNCREYVYISRRCAAFAVSLKKKKSEYPNSALV